MSYAFSFRIRYLDTCAHSNYFLVDGFNFLWVKSQFRCFPHDVGIDFFFSLMVSDVNSMFTFDSSDTFTDFHPLL